MADRLTDAGVEFLEDLTEEYRSGKAKEEVTESLGLNGYWLGMPVVDLPQSFDPYGSLLEDPDTEYVAKITSRAAGRPYFHEIGARSALSQERSFYTSENFTEARVWKEAVDRGDEDLFAPIIAWDAKDFSWIVMERVDGFDQLDPVHEDSKPIYEKRGWNPNDIEVGKKDGELVAFDYGMVRPQSGWTLDEADLIRADEAYWPDSNSVPENEASYTLEVDLPEVRKVMDERVDYEFKHTGIRSGPSSDSTHAIIMTDMVDDWLGDGNAGADRHLTLPEAIDSGVKDQKTSAVLLAALGSYCGLDVDYVEGIKKPLQSDEEERKHSWTSLKLGETEHLIDLELGIFGRYNPMVRGHGYVEEDRIELDSEREFNFYEKWLRTLPGSIREYVGDPGRYDL